jgi:SAM-dependent methyltransferase
MYPTEQPSAKFDLISQRFAGGNLKDAIGFDSTASLFHALDQPLPTDLKVLSTLYIYPSDAPTPPISRSLAMIGVADVSLRLVRQLIGEGAGDDTEHKLPSCLTRSTVAVRRADGSHKEGLEDRHLHNSQAFSKTMRRLHSERVVAILASDKFGRFGILAPSVYLTDDGATSSHDFYANLYLGKVKAVKEYLQGESRDPTNTSQSALQEEGYGSNSTELWVPPGTSDNADTGLWQPPPSDGDAGNGIWQPPGSSEDVSTYDFGMTTASSTIASLTSGNKRNFDEFHSDSGAAAADEFYSKLTRRLETRADSRIYHLRAYNGWVKATQIQELNPKTKGNRDGPLRILDLACGKGGDLGKWTLHSRGVRTYVGSDVARGSLKDAAIRARKLRGKFKRCTFTCADLGADVPGRLKSPKHKHMQKLLTWSLQNEPPTEKDEPNFQMIRGGGISLEDHFDVVSIQFAIHYMMSSRKRARRFFRTVGELLDIGGNLIITTIDARRVVWHLMNMGLDLCSEQDDDKNAEDVVISVGNGACKLCFQWPIVRRIFSLNTVDPTSEDMFGLEYSFTLVEGDDHSRMESAMP